MVRFTARAFIAAALSLVACVGGPAASPPAISPTPGEVAITASTRSEIAALLQKRQTALVAKDLSGFQSTIDMTRPALRRCQQETFDIATRQGANSVGPAVGKVERYLTSYARAYVDDGGNGYVRLYFKSTGSGWLLTEPKMDELGGEKTKTAEGIELSYWGIDDDIIDAFARAGAETRDFLLKLARTQPARPFALRMFPTRESAGLTASCATLGSSRSAPSGDRFLRFYRYWIGPDFVGPSELQRGVLKHEGLHWLQEQTIPGINSRMDWWLVEGWPDFVGESRTSAAKVNAVCRTATPTFKELVDGPDSDKVPPERISQFYSFANTMVEYLYATYGENKYWDFLPVYKEIVDPQLTYPRVLGIPPERLYMDWIAYAKKKYC